MCNSFVRYDFPEPWGPLIPMTMGFSFKLVPCASMLELIKRKATSKADMVHNTKIWWGIFSLELSFSFYIIIRKWKLDFSKMKYNRTYEPNYIRLCSSKTVENILTKIYLDCLDLLQLTYKFIYRVYHHTWFSLRRFVYLHRF